MRRLLLAALLPASVLLAASALPAQYVLSAMAGYIYHTEGEVWLGDRSIAPKPEDFEHVLEGRRLRTGDGRAELLLVPGSFVRIGGGSEVEMVSSGLTSAVLRLHQGSLIVDLQTQFEKDSIAVRVADYEVRFRKTGLYRVDAQPGVSPLLRVSNGRARIERDGAEGFDVKAHQRAALNAGVPQKAAETNPDRLDEWNDQRHEKLVALAEQVRKEHGNGMSNAERDLLRMILDRPTRPPASNRPQPRTTPPANGRRHP